MTREEIVSAFSELKELVKGMKIPAHRTADPHWLNKSLGVYNSNHPNYSKAMEVIKKLLASGVRSEPK